MSEGIVRDESARLFEGSCGAADDMMMFEEYLQYPQSLLDRKAQQNGMILRVAVSSQTKRRSSLLPLFGSRKILACGLKLPE